ncbi:MAG: LuxR C-terminal-related transcriptional regulator [Pseudomonadota bacterium]
MHEDRLSPRELEIARAYAHGDTYNAIAERLHIAPSTVRTHLGAIYRKLGVSSKVQLHQMLDADRPHPPQQSDQSAVISELALGLEEALRRERAYIEVLRIISGSQGRIEEVIAAALDYALDLCDAEFGILFEYDPSKGFRAAHTRRIPEAFRDWFEQRGDFQPSEETALGRILRTHETVNLFDVRAEGVYRRDEPLRAATVELGGARSFIGIPMMARDRLIGAFTIYRQQLRPFDEKTAEVASAFAEQSVIAIENARMMSELRAAAIRRSAT